MTVAVPDKKLREVLQECMKWTGRKKANVKMIQSLVRRLLFLANAITPARKFVTRILATLRTMPDRGWINISEPFKLDVRWFLQYAKQANGMFYYTPQRRYAEIQCDSSLTGGGWVHRYSLLRLGIFRSAHAQVSPYPPSRSH